MTIETIRTIFQYLQDIIFIYPFTMSWVWIAGGLFFYFIHEFKKPGPDELPDLVDLPMVSIIIPCFNESDNIRETIAALSRLNYPSHLFEIIAVNDGSQDETKSILTEMTDVYNNLKVVNLKQNKGKALALKTGTLIAKNEFLVCIDGDAILEPNALHWLVYRLVENPKIGAVTGNPRIRNRTTLLGKLQTGEFSSIIGLIKRSQMDYGCLFTVSGVVAAFRKKALHEVDYWGVNMLTEDIDITWRLQKNGWQVEYIPNAMCWILMPETFNGLWKQRLRWARGGAEIILEHGLSIFHPRSWKLLPIMFNFLTAVLWANIVIIVLLAACFQLLSQLFSTFSAYGPIDIGINTLIPSSWGIILGITFLVQSTISLIIEQKYEPGLLRYLGWMIWYPLGYWLIMVVTTVAGFYQALFLKRKKLATWVSPDRGV